MKILIKGAINVLAEWHTDYARDSYWVLSYHSLIYCSPGQRFCTGGGNTREETVAQARKLFGDEVADNLTFKS